MSPWYQAIAIHRSALSPGRPPNLRPIARVRRQSERVAAVRAGPGPSILRQMRGPLSDEPEELAVVTKVGVTYERSVVSLRSMASAGHPEVGPDGRWQIRARDCGLATSTSQAWRREIALPAWVLAPVARP